ncbi:MAG: histidine phosphatase family protein [Ornithinibacter sp.]
MSSATDATDSTGRLVLVRHGQTEWSRDGRHTGRTDVPLTDAGERDARGLTTRLAEFDFALVLCSPLSRARRTAELAGLVPQEDLDLLEWDYGGYEGLSTPDIRDRLGDPGWTVFDDGVVAGATPGETVEEVAARASRVLVRVQEPLAHGDVALVAHGHLLRILAATYLRQDARFGAQLLLDAGALSVLDSEHGVPGIRSWNETVR